MNKAITLGAGIGLGTGIMYLLDPDRGKRRRALVRDQFKHAMRKTGDGLGATARDVSNRARGLAAQVQSKFSGEEPTDDVLVQRVRSKLGRVVSHPSAIQTSSEAGKVTLSGPILRHEVDELLRCVESIRGVKEIENHLEVYKEAGDNPALQGGRVRPGDRMEFMQEHWSPAARVVAGATGAGLALYGGRRRGILGAGLGAAGLLLAARGITNLELKRLTGLGGGRQAVNINKTVSVDAPVEEVFSIWSDFENFPLFMKNVLEVRRAGDDRTHWRVAGPAGVPLEWDAETTLYEPNRLLAWKTLPGAVVDHAGIVRFEPNDDGSTRIDVKLSYNPPAGAMGHGVAALLGTDPKSEIDEDLMRMKSVIETGKLPHDAAKNVTF